MILYLNGNTLFYPRMSKKKKKYLRKMKQFRSRLKSGVILLLMVVLLFKDTDFIAIADFF
ncbi:MAG: hypothetical protein H6767_00495 [Candidatus Peribacteria bacterium]|nr:MAG: hypothetical protein H6767_00495 [Candidatus Peribacteria bacterium]